MTDGLITIIAMMTILKVAQKSHTIIASVTQMKCFAILFRVE